jgi:BolA protein
MQRGIHALAIMAYTPEEFAELPDAPSLKS